MNWSTAKRVASPVVPESVRETLSSPGNSLDEPTCARVGRALGGDFSTVRVHSDARANDSAGELGALAYSWGEHVVLGRHAATGDSPLLRHELVHVRQSGGSKTGLPEHVLPKTHAAEGVAERASAGPAAVGATALSGLALARDPRLGELVGKLPPFAVGGTMKTPNDTAEDIARLFAGVDLSDPDNLRVVVRAIGSSFPDDVMLEFLRIMAVPAGVALADVREQRLDRQLAPMQIQPGGAWKTYSPFFPATEVLSRDLRPLANGLIMADQRGSAFLGGVLDGMGPDVDHVIADLRPKLLDSALVNAVLPEVIWAGTAVGIVQGVAGDIKGLWDLIRDLPGAIESFRELVEGLLSDEGDEIARAMGGQIGHEWRAKLMELRDANTFRFIYEIGRLVGPTVVAVVLALLTDGASLGGEAAKAAGGAAKEILTAIRSSQRAMKALNEIKVTLVRLYHDERGAINLGKLFESANDNGRRLSRLGSRSEEVAAEFAEAGSIGYRGRNTPVQVDAAKRRGIHVTTRYVDFHEHHLLPRAFKKWFAEPPRNLDVDNFVVRLAVSDHEAAHVLGWNKYWAAFIESRDGRTVTVVDVESFLKKMRKKYDIKGDYFRYTKAPVEK